MSRTIGLCVAAWLFPGAGHLLLKKWGRGGVFCAAIMILFAYGLLLEGQLFGFSPTFFGLLKLIADAGVGLPYVLGKIGGWGAGDLTSYGYEYGNTSLFLAGLLNMLVVVDTFDIAEGRKQ